MLFLTENTDISVNFDNKIAESIHKIYRFYLISFCLFIVGAFIYDFYFRIFSLSTFFNIIFFVFSVYMIFHLRYFTNIVLFGMYFLVNFWVFFDSSYCGRESGISLMYFNLIFSIIYLFELRGLRKMMGVLILQIVILTIINFKTDFKLFYSPIYTLEHQKVLFIYISASAILLTLALIYIILQKHDLFLKLYQLKSKEYERLITISKHRDVTTAEIEELNDLAVKKSPAFYDKFCIAYPELIKVLENEELGLSNSEIQICAYIVLNYSTKDISRFTNSSIKSVESKKYRIRKKINLSPDLGLTSTTLLDL